MDALKDSTTAWSSEPVTSPTQPAARNLVAIWARGRRQITPWAYPHLRGLAATRLTVGIFLVALGALLLAHGDNALAAIPFAGAALNLAIGSLDMTAARSAATRS
jgi:hypothetical protein